MGADASPIARFNRAIQRGSLAQAEAAAWELGRLDLEDALRFVLLLQRAGDPRYERAAVRLAGRVLAERSGLGFGPARSLLDGLAGLGGVAPEVARRRIALALDAAGLERASDYVASSEDVASPAR